MSIYDMYKGKYILTMEDNTKYIIDFDTKEWDTYEWYKAMGTLENNLDNYNILNDVKCKIMKKL